MIAIGGNEKPLAANVHGDVIRTSLDDRNGESLNRYLEKHYLETCRFHLTCFVIECYKPAHRVCPNLPN
jgi:hypothetical protein